MLSDFCLNKQVLINQEYTLGDDKYVSVTDDTKKVNALQGRFGYCFPKSLS